MGKLPRIEWPEEYSELKRMEESLLCGICYDYMDTSVMTPCSHNYCSLCIRKYLHYKTQCPACFEKTFEKDLHTNRILDELIMYFGKIRVKLVKCISGAKIDIGEDVESVQDSPAKTPIRPARTNQNQKKTPAKIETEHNEVSVNNVCKVQENIFSIATPQKIISSPSTSGLTKVATIFTPKNKKNSVQTACAKTVPCPVCRVEISEIHINKHLDDCLKREKVTEQPARLEQKRKPLPKLVFSLMKDVELRKKMKELGLPSQGDRKTLETRFQRYLTLFNAECDKKEPRTIQELLKQCNDEEMLEKKMLKVSQAANRLKVTRNSEQNVIEKAQKVYLETNKQSYESLIADIKGRQKIVKPPVRRSLVNEDSKSVPNESLANHDSEKNLIPVNEDANVSYSMNTYDLAFQDSDSSSSCPLQHYASDNPSNFLSLQMTTRDTPVNSPTKFSPLRNRPHDQSLLNSAEDRTPIKKIQLRKFDSDLPLEGHSINDVNTDVFNLTTDDESNDEVPPSPQATASHSTKRPKLALKQRTNLDNSNEVQYKQSNLKGRQLALSIVRDFTFDTSSSDSVESEPVHEAVDIKTSEAQNNAAKTVERVNPDILKFEKENHGLSTTNTSAINRPLRKRNCNTRLQSSNIVDTAKSKENKKENSEEFIQIDAHGDDEKIGNSSCIDSMLKRRRRRNAVTSTETEPKTPPRRPLRKRYVNSALPDAAHQKS